MDPEKAPESQLALALTGTMAARNPNDGYAILGEKGKPGRLYRTGASLKEGLTGRLYQTFADRVVLEINGHLETLALPRHSLAGLNNVTLAAPGTHPDSTPAAPAGPSLRSLGVRAGDNPDHPTAAETWFEMLHPQRQLTGGVKLRPDARLREAYNLRPNDVVTAVNGVDISGPDSSSELARALKTTDGKTMELSVVRRGVSQVLTVSLAE